MKRFGHLNRDVSRVLARMGHTDSAVIADFKADRAVFAMEAKACNPAVTARACRLAHEQMQVEFVTHEPQASP
jgi:D-ribose pyranase